MINHDYGTVIAADVGFTTVKARSGEKTTIFPSVVGSPVPQTSFSIKQNQRSLAISGNGHYTPVGDTALLQSNYASGRRDAEWVLSQDWLTLFQCAVSEFVTVPYAKVKVVTGLPVDDWNKFQEALRNKLCQTFAFRRAGRDQQRVEVVSAHILTQPYGSLLDMALGDHGEFLNNSWVTGRTGVVDLGGNTMNLLAVNELEELGQQTNSDTFGLLYALDEVRDSLRASFTRFLPDTHEVSEWLAKGSFRYCGETHEMWPYAEPYLSPLIDMVMTKIYDTWTEIGRFDAILLSGGGSAVLGKYIKARLIQNGFPNVEIARDPRWANVRGYHKYGMRGFADA